MDQLPNPYQPPALIDETPSWWGRIRTLFRVGPKVVSLVQTASFSKGDAIIYDGISFFVDPGDRKILFAASPSSDHSDQRMDLITAEVMRVLPGFLGEYPSLQRRLRGRKLMVRMIESYQSRQVDYVRQSPVAAVIEGDDLIGD
ncbi:MAG: hypothetical protein WBD31_14020 [Rubripirellula sp.]